MRAHRAACPPPTINASLAPRLADFIFWRALFARERSLSFALRALRALTHLVGLGVCIAGGVLEFIAQEGMVYLPFWMMENMHLNEGDVIHLRSASIPKGSFVKLQPQTSDFIQISNPKAVLEKSLGSFSALVRRGAL